MREPLPGKESKSQKWLSEAGIKIHVAKGSSWIRISQAPTLPLPIKDAIQRLSQAGFICYVVGGSIRDFLLGRPAKDHDLVTNATPEQVVDLFERSIDVGKKFGVIQVVVSEGDSFEIATFRKDLEYKDHRHPESIEFSDVSEDAKRRDFTINGLYYDIKSNRVLDEVGGIEDLEAKQIRCIGEPSKRFREDALRMLRAVRFSAALNFEIEKKTSESILIHSPLIREVSSERIRDELNLILQGPMPVEGFQLLFELKLLKVILPELETLKGIEQIPSYFPKEDLWKNTFRVFEHLRKNHEKPSLACLWAALLHDIGKPVAFSKNQLENFQNSEREGAILSKKILQRLKFPQKFVEQVSQMVESLPKFRGVFEMRESTIIRWVREPYFEDLLALHEAHVRGTDGNLAFHQFALSRFLEEKKYVQKEREKLLSGDDLLALGLSAGPQFSEILREIEDLALEGEIRSKDEALEYVIKNFVV